MFSALRETFICQEFPVLLESGEGGRVGEWGKAGAGVAWRLPRPGAVRCQGNQRRCWRLRRVGPRAGSGSGWRAAMNSPGSSGGGSSDGRSSSSSSGGDVISGVSSRATIGSTASVLAELNWDDGFAIPVASEENKRLEEKFRNMQKEKVSIENQVADYEERIAAMTAHLKNVKQEFNLTQSLSRARKNEIETEKHFKAIAEREVGRLKSEIKRLENEMVSLREKKNSQENSVFKVTQKLEALRCQMNWDQQALEAWLEESARKDNDAMVIQKYAQQDDGKLRVLTLKIELLTEDCNRRRKILDNELTETLAAQIELDKAAEDFRRVHHERQELIKQWENTIEQMQRRDQEIDHCGLLLAQARRAIRAKESVLKDKIQFLANESGNNMEYEKRIGVADRQAARLRLDYQKEESNRNQLQDEMDTLKATVDGTASELELMRSSVANLKKEIQEKSLRLNFIKDQNESLSNKLKSVTDHALTLEEKAAKMEEILKEKEKTNKEKETLALQLRDTQFKKTKELQALKEKEKGLLSEIDGHRGLMKNLYLRLHRLDVETLRQQEIMYTQDFYIQQVERRLSRLKGELNTDERQILEAKLEELTKIADKKKQACNVLQAQQKKLQNDIHFIKLAMNKTGEEMAGLNTRVDELNLFTDKSEKLLKKARADKQDLMIEDNLLKLELKRVRNMLYNKAEKVLSLEKRKQQLKTAMEERTAEIKVHKAMLENQIRIAEQERQTMSTEFHERLSKIDKLKSRYEIVTIVMMPPEGEEEKSQVYYVIKTAQEKEDLQREGDALDAKIQRAEKECDALKNTLHVLNNCNSNYRNSFKKVTENSEEYEEKVQLEKEKRAADEKYRYKRRQIKELQEDIQAMQITLDNLSKEEALCKEKSKEKNALIVQLTKEIDYQKPKLERVIKQVFRLSRELRSLKKTTSETLEEQDIDFRELKDFSKSVDKMLLEISEANPDLSSVLQTYFEQAAISFPAVSCRHSSRSSGHSSSTSSISLKSSASSSSQAHLKVVSLTLPSTSVMSSRPSTQSSSSSTPHSRTPK
ncbi:coiled-coil domain-containing protein 39 [Eublepharis macularius]|uniref:Coiled-coil domain-containing protein 39 n=1 Tax=Eublepharis macularius TaxID=481883 RepID=A0AA97L1V6_EUBMA|nr:coiled-coil domain-containing protein 39 [Eublepharis macularius]